jgi:hypothetical protein
VYTQKGELIQEAVPIGERNLYKYIRWLERNKFINVSRITSTARGYEANLFEIDFKRILEREPNVLKIPRKQRNKESLPFRLGTLSPSVCEHKGFRLSAGENIQKDKEPQKEKEHKERDELPSRILVQKQVEEVTNRTHLKRAEKAGRTTVLTLITLRASWQEAMVKDWPGIPILPITPAAFGKFRTVTEKWKLDSDPRKFFEWVLLNWNSIRDELVRKKEKYALPGKIHLAKAPDFSSFVQYVYDFVREYKSYLSDTVVREKRSAVIDEYRKSPEFLSKKIKALQEELKAKDKAIAAAEKVHSNYMRSISIRPDLREEQQLVTQEEIDDALNNESGTGEWQ